MLRYIQILFLRFLLHIFCHIGEHSTFTPSRVIYLIFLQYLLKIVNVNIKLSELSERIFKNALIDLFVNILLENITLS